MKKFTSVIFTFIIFYLSLNIAFAHSGRTDYSGGHYDRSTGEYHYHHGYSAHQHPNGQCPYNKDKTSLKESEQSEWHLYVISATVLLSIYIVPWAVHNHNKQKARNTIPFECYANKTDLIVGEDISEGKYLVSALNNSDGMVKIYEDGVVVKRVLISKTKKIKFKKGKKINLYNCRIEKG